MKVLNCPRMSAPVHYNKDAPKTLESLRRLQSLGPVLEPDQTVEQENGADKKRYRQDPDHDHSFRISLAMIIRWIWLVPS